MLRRSVSFRRMLAVALAGAALGACSNSAEDTTAPASDANLGPVNPLNFELSTNSISFTYDEATFEPATQAVEVGGIVVTTTPYVRVLSINYSPSNVKDWLRITQRPALLSDQTLGVRLTFTPRYVPGAENGGLSATVAVTVPGARNGPQMITVNVGDVFGCPVLGNLAYPSLNPLLGNLQPGTTCQSEVLAGERVFDVWSMTVPANATFTVLMRARPTDVGGDTGNLYDPYLFLVDAQLNEVVRADDDCGRGFNSPLYDSRVVWTNPTNQPKKFYLLASQFSTNQFGTYTVDIHEGDFFPTYPGNPSFCSGYSPTSAGFLAPGAADASDPAIAALQKEIRAKEQAYKQRQQ